MLSGRNTTLTGFVSSLPALARARDALPTRGFLRLGSSFCAGTRPSSRGLQTKAIWHAGRSGATSSRASVAASSSLADLQHQRDVAVEAVIKAGVVSTLIRDQFADGDEIAKADASPVTVADFAVQALVLYFLHRAFPSDFFIAEESSSALRNDPAVLSEVLRFVNAIIPVPDRLTAPQLCATIDLGTHRGGDGARTWILDPVDGTKGFIRGDQYCIALGLVQRGRVDVGVLGCPNLPLSLTAEVSRVGSVFHSVRGDGAWMQGASVRAERRRLEPPAGEGGEGMGGAVFMESVERAHSSHEKAGRIAERLGIWRPPVRMDSQAKYGVLSRGECQVFMRFPRDEYVENVWDHAAGSLVLEEAGGRVTDGKGQPLKFGLGRKMDNEDGIVATRGVDHSAIVAAVQAVLHGEHAARGSSN